MTSLRAGVAFVVLLILTAGCPDKSPPASAPDAATAAAVDAGTPIPEELVLTVLAETVDAGTVVLPLEAGARPEVPRIQKLEIQSNLSLEDYRIRIFDEADRAMVSDDTAEDLPDGIRYVVTFPEPLKPGHRYALVMDAQVGPQIEDRHGRNHADIRLEFKIAGEKEKPPPPQKPKRRRRR